MLIGRRNLGEHLPWIVATLAAAGLSLIWYLSILAGTTWERRPSGSSKALFIFGVAGGLICLFEFLLWPRKVLFRTWRLLPVKAWMRAHIWLGLLAVPLLILHSGFYFRNLEATVLLGLFLVVIVSGVWGLVMQQFLPSKMLNEVPAETIFSQIRHVSNLLIEEAARVVNATCGAPTVPEGQQVREALLPAPADEQTFFTVGAVRVIGGVHGKVLESQAALPYVVGCDTLRDFLNDELRDYLKRGERSRSGLAVPSRARARFDDLRVDLPEESHEAIGALENLADQRRQFDRQARLHYWLHNWLWVHLPLSVALMVLMTVHVFRTLQYWWPH